jgi:hypothetical protein
MHSPAISALMLVDIFKYLDFFFGFFLVSLILSTTPCTRIQDEANSIHCQIIALETSKETPPTVMSDTFNAVASKQLCRHREPQFRRS